MREWMRKAGERRDFAPNDVITSDESTAAINVKYRQVYAMALYQDTSASREDLVEAVATLRELARYWKRVAGDVNPDTLEVLTELDRAGMTLEDVAAPSRIKSKQHTLLSPHPALLELRVRLRQRVEDALPDEALLDR